MYNACSDSKIPQNITFQPTTALSAAVNTALRQKNRRN